MDEPVTDTPATSDGVRALGSAFALRMVILANAVFVLAGCAGMERHTSASGFPDVLNAEAMASQSTYDAVEERPAPVKATEPEVTPFPPCATESSSYRVRDLSVPWAQRRYLMPSGTICIPDRVRSL